jgi:hypothetical protein
MLSALEKRISFHILLRLLDANKGLRMKHKKGALHHEQ